MASRKDQKEQARERREALVAEQARADLRRRRYRNAGFAVAIAALAVVGAIIVSSGGGGPSTGGIQTGTTANAVVGSVDSTLVGAEQSGTRLGKADAPVTMTYFGDLECPVCRAFTDGALDDVIRQDVVPGKLDVVYRSLETATRDPTTFMFQQAAALAAGAQNRLWQYVELFYRQQGEEGTGYVSDEFLRAIAKQVPGLSVSRWNADRGRAAYETQVRADAAAADAAGASATPTLVIKGPRGSKTLVGDAGFGDVQSAVKAVS